ncbi:AraC family transcriptional regulator [Acetanaerobacterium elongatum]|uniref:AraC-type DNA-binding protein n=1 Tax=Acetanaerobacterium elongatum TaxID=258515 RepID=A0A1G9WHC9_9FIRM|nr:AraC family transcriptional regulator [Acetanaerobacterium elongatum]SDM83944.1 AraC-type DNA-binding protein [Acetanaerobacterium elongatum]
MDNGVYKYSYKTQLRENLGLSVFNTGRQRCTPSYTWGPGVRDHYLIHYVTGGKGTVYIEGKSFKAAAGDAFLITPNKPVSYTADSDEPWEYLWVGFNGNDAQSLVMLMGFTPENPVCHLPDGETAERLLGDIYASVGSAPFQETRMSGYLYLFLAHLIEVFGKPRQSAGGREYIDLALRFIEYNYSTNIGVDDIATHIGLSRSHLYRLFIKHLGLSPNDFLTEFRISKACALIRSTNLSIGEIASSVGFDDQLYFSRVFKRHKGVSPARYV